MRITIVVKIFHPMNEHMPVGDIDSVGELTLVKAEGQTKMVLLQQGGSPPYLVEVDELISAVAKLNPLAAEEHPREKRFWLIAPSRLDK